MIKLILSDIDGTLIPFGQAHASARTLAAIEAVRSAGYHFGLATGRDVVELTVQFEGHTEPFSTGILSNGKKIMLDDEIVKLSLIDTNALQRMAELVHTYPQSFATAYPFHTDVSNPVYCVGVGQEDIEMWAKKYAFKPIPVASIPNIEVIGATIACPHDESMMLEIIERGKELCPEFDFVRPAANWTDIVPKGLNKGTALALLLDELGITSDEVIMFGDADNDLAILNAVEHSVAVANATPAVKAASRWHIGSAEDESVAEALERLAAGEWPFEE